MLRVVALSIALASSIPAGTLVGGVFIIVGPGVTQFGSPPFGGSGGADGWAFTATLLTNANPDGTFTFPFELRFTEVSLVCDADICPLAELGFLAVPGFALPLGVLPFTISIDGSGPVSSSRAVIDGNEMLFGPLGPGNFTFSTSGVKDFGSSPGLVGALTVPKSLRTPRRTAWAGRLRLT
jgi:hypothetical protein